MAKPEISTRWQQLARSKFLVGDMQGASRAQQPHYKCGVSVAYLKSFAATLGGLKDEMGLRESTTALNMQRIIVPFVAKAGSSRCEILQRPLAFVLKTSGNIAPRQVL